MCFVTAPLGLPYPAWPAAHLEIFPLKDGMEHPLRYQEDYIGYDIEYV